MAKTVLLARPHPFIVAEMKPFLEQGGYAADKLENQADLATRARSSAGVVISLAISAGESAEEVLKRLRQGAQRIPVLFAAMLGVDEIRGSLERLAKNAGIQATILGVAAGNENAAALGKEETFVYISKADLADPTRRAIALRMVQRHFR